MKALILAAGYGTRLDRDLRTDTSETYAHLIGVPKPLLPIGNQPLITHWAKCLKNIEEIDQVFVVTNSVNHKLFEDWAKSWPEVKLVCDGSTSNDSRIGAVACMKLAVKHFNIDDDLIIIAGDTLFYEDFKLENIIAQHHTFQKANALASTLLYVTCTDEEVQKYGILETGPDHRVTGFLEKPEPHETPSRKECPCFYILSKSALVELETFLVEKKEEPLKSRDATGNFIKYLYQRMPVYATEISGRFDVGGLSSYIVCHSHFLNRTSPQV